MATGTAGTAAREFVSQQVHYLRAEIAYTDDGNDVEIGILPAGAVVLPSISGVNVETAFNGGTTNDVEVGVSGDASRFGSALALGVSTFVPIDDITDLKVTADTTVIAGVVSTAAASAGTGSVIIAYVVDNDK